MNRRILATTVAAAALVAGVLVTPSLAGSAGKGDAALRALYNSPRFEQLSGAAQMALARKFGPRIGAAQFAGRLAANPLGGGTAVNDNAADTTAQDTQSETTMLVFGKSVVSGFNDSGSCLPSCGSGSATHFTGWALSKNGGTTFHDLGRLPNSTDGDAGDPSLAVDKTSKTIYFSTLAFNNFNHLETFRSTDGGRTFGPPVNSAPGWGAGNEQDKEWLAVDNNAGPGQGTVYESWTRFGSSTDIRVTHSTDGGTTWLPNQGVQIASGTVQGSFVVVGPDHAVYVFWLNGSGSPQKIMVRKSTDGGVTFGAPVTVATLAVTGVNGDLGLGGGFRTNAFPHAAINPVNGDIYVAYNDNPPGSDKGDIEFVQSTDGGATFSVPVRVNDDTTLRDQWQPDIAVTPNGTALFIGWYDRRLDPNNNLIDWFGTIGDISGSTVAFRPNTRITSTSFPVVIGQDPVINFVYMGDYDTAAADNNFFYTTWGDNSLPSAAHAHQPDVRFAKIAVGP